MNGESDESDLDRWLHHDLDLPHVTAEAVTEALNGFAAPLAKGKDMAWLAMAVRRSLGITIQHVSDGPDRRDNASVRREMEGLAKSAGDTWKAIFGRSSEADSVMWDYAFRNWDGQGGEDLGNGLATFDPDETELRRFKAALSELDWLSGFLRRAAQGIESDRGPWREGIKKRLRIERGCYLAPVFEAAFGQPATANNWPSDARHVAPTAFMDFYQRMMTLAFPTEPISNLSDVLKVACQHQRRQPAWINEGLIPGL